VALLKGLMRFFGYLYHGLLALFLLAISGVALSTGMHSLKMNMLPWSGESLTWWLFGGSLVGLIIVVLAVKRILPALFFVWSLVVAGFMLKGYVFSGYHFGGGDFRTAMCLIAGAVISLVGAWYGMKQRPARG
jgi:hypothetical protein